MTVRTLIEKLEKLEKLSSPNTEVAWDPYADYRYDINDVWMTKYSDGSIEISISDYGKEEKVYFGERTFV